MQKQILDDVLCAAFEGGINHWCTNQQVLTIWPAGAEYASDTVSRGATVILGVYQDSPVELDKAKLEKGIRAAAKLAGVSVSDFGDDHDAGMADNAVQFAVFGEVRYV